MALNSYCRQFFIGRMWSATAAPSGEPGLQPILEHFRKLGFPSLMSNTRLYLELTDKISADSY